MRTLLLTILMSMRVNTEATQQTVGVYTVQCILCPIQFTPAKVKATSSLYDSCADQHRILFLGKEYAFQNFPLSAVYAHHSK